MKSNLQVSILRQLETCTGLAAQIDFDVDVGNKRSLPHKKIYSLKEIDKLSNNLVKILERVVREQKKK